MQRIAVEDRRAALLAAALRVIGRDGLARASVRAVAAEAGMPTASVHYVFASHAAMLGELVEAILAAQTTGVAAEVVEARTFAEFAAGALQAWLDRATADPDAEVALHEIVHRSRSSAELPHLADAVVGQYAAAVASFVDAAEARFGVGWRVPRDDVARFVLVLVDGVAARWLVDRDDAGAARALAVGAQALTALAVEP